jgi:hypothetical protein
MSQINAQHIRNLARQIDNATDCEVLLLIIDTHLNAVLDVISSMIKTQADILSGFFPIIKPPGINPRKIVRWIKKFISGTIKPQIRAYLTMILQLIQLASALATLANSIANARTKLQQCLGETLPAVLNQRINAAIRDVRAPLDNALLEIDLLQARIENLINVPLSARIDTSSPEAFARTADTAFRSIEAQLNSFIDELEIEDEEDDSEDFDLLDTSSVGAFLSLQNDTFNVVAQSQPIANTVVLRDNTGSVSAVDFNSTSDISLKYDIKPIESAIEKTIKLNGVSFKWKSNDLPGLGLIAQEVETVVPSAVQEIDGIKTVSYGNLVGLLIESVKYQQIQIENQQKQINDLKGYLENYNGR